MENCLPKRERLKFFHKHKTIIGVICTEFGRIYNFYDIIIYICIQSNVEIPFSYANFLIEYYIVLNGK